MDTDATGKTKSENKTTVHGMQKKIPAYTDFSETPRWFPMAANVIAFCPPARFPARLLSFRVASVSNTAARRLSLRVAASGCRSFLRSPRNWDILLQSSLSRESLRRPSFAPRAVKYPSASSGLLLATFRKTTSRALKCLESKLGMPGEDRAEIPVLRELKSLAMSATDMDSLMVRSLTPIATRSRLGRVEGAVAVRFDIVVVT